MSDNNESDMEWAFFYEGKEVDEPPMSELGDPLEHVEMRLVPKNRVRDE